MQSRVSTSFVLLSAAALIGNAQAQLGALPTGLGGIGDGTGAVPLPPPEQTEGVLGVFGLDPDVNVTATPTAAPLPPPAPTPRVMDAPELELIEQPFLANLPRLCPCTTPVLTPAEQVKTDDIRFISNEFCDGGDSPMNSFGLSNMDHDVVGSEEEGGRDDEVENISLDGPERIMPLSTIGPMVGDGDDGVCEGQRNTHTGLIDGHPIYSGSEEGEEALRDGESCRLLVTPNPEGANGDFLPLGRGHEGGPTGTFLIAGDRRIWVREHNRLCGVLEGNQGTNDLSGDEQFEISKAAVIAKMQRGVLQWITVHEFLPALGIGPYQLWKRKFQGFKIDSSLATVEFSIAWRLGHTVIPDKLGDRDISELFRGERNFLTMDPAENIAYQPGADALIDNLVKTLATTTASEVDGKMSNSLRNILFGVNTAGDLAGTLAQLDLCAFNIFRARDLHIPTYAGLAECVGITPDAQTEAMTPDPWLGLLREPKNTGKVLGPTLEAIVVEHFSRVLFGPHGNFFLSFNSGGQDLRRKAWPLLGEILRSSMASVLSANSGAELSGNAFKA